MNHEINTDAHDHVSKCLIKMAGQLRPAVMRVIPTDKPEEFTELIYEELQLNINLSNNFFSLANLKRRK